jgi:DNA-binding CsgD family transcriptional regulator
MSIIIATTAAEAAAVVRELDGQSVTVTTTLDVSWAGLATDTTAATAVGDTPTVEDESPQVEDIDDTPRTPRRLKSWTKEEEDQVKIWIRKGMSVAEVAESLGRTPSSVRNKLLVLERERAVCGLDPIRPKKVAA